MISGITAPFPSVATLTTTILSKPKMGMPIRNYKETEAFQIEKDCSSHSIKEPSSPKMMKSLSLQRLSNVSRPLDGVFNLQESPKVRSPSAEKMLENGQALDAADKDPSIRRHDSFEMRLPELPKIDVESVHQQMSNDSNPESPISPLCHVVLESFQRHKL